MAKKRVYYRDIKGRFTSRNSSTYVPTSGPGSRRWARSSIEFRHGTKQLKKSRMIRIYSPKEHLDVPYFNGGWKKVEPSASSKKLREQYDSWLRGKKPKRRK